jgi:ABC-type transport system involved in Fe-S cluster assembly fused permease/ATPase subunit
MVLEKAGGCLSVLPMGTASEKNKKTDNDIEKGHSKDGTPEDVLIASKLSYSHDFITSFTEGYNTDVGESAVMVSGGQKQVIRPHYNIINLQIVNHSRYSTRARF